MENASQCLRGQVGRGVGHLFMLIAYFLLLFVPDVARSQTKILPTQSTIITNDQRIDAPSGCGLLEAFPCYGNTVKDKDNALAEDALFSRLYASPGGILGLGAYQGGLELTFPSNLPADTWSYVRIGADNSLLRSLLGGSLGKALGSVLGGVLLGNQEIQIEALLNNASRLVRTNTQGFDTDRVKLLQDAAGHYYIGIRPGTEYNKIRLLNRSVSAVGLGTEYTLDVYSAFAFSGTGTDCGRPAFTAYDGGGISLSVLQVDNQHLERAIDSDINSYSELKQGSVLDAQVLGSLSQNFYFPSRSAATHTFNIRLSLAPSGVLNADLLGGVVVIAYDNNTEVFRKALSGGLLNGVDILQLLQNGNAATLSFGPGAGFDRVEVRLNSLVGVNLAGSAVRIHDVQRYSGAAGCENPAITAPAATAPMLAQKDCASGLVSFDHANFATRAVDGNNDTYATLEASSGLALGLGAYAGHVELGFAQPVAANKTVYVRIDFDPNQLLSLLDGSVGSLVNGVVDNVLFGNHYFVVEAKQGATNILRRSSNSRFSATGLNAAGAGAVRIVQDKLGHYYVAITANQSFSSIRITENLSAAVGLGVVRNMNVYHACFATASDICSQAIATFARSSGISVDLLGLGNVGVSNAQRAIDGDASTFSRINLGLLSVAGYAAQVVDFESLSDPNAVFKLRLALKANQTLQADLLGAYEIVAYAGETEVYRRSLGGGLLNGTNVLALLGNGQAGTLTFAPGKAFDRIEIRVNSLLNVSAFEASVELYDVRRFGPPGSACADPDFVLPTATAGPFEVPACDAQVVAWEHADYANLAADGNNESFATLTASSGTLLGLNAYSGFLEYAFPADIPANKTTYVRIDMDGNILGRLLGGTLGTLLDNAGGLLLGNHYFSVEAKTALAGGTTVLTGSSAAGFTDVSGGDLRIVQDNIGRFYIAITPTAAYRNIRITEHFPALVGASQDVASMRIYEACMEIGTNNCLPGQFTSFDQSGLTLGLLNGAGVSNADHAISVNSSDYSEISTGTVAIAAQVSQRIYFNKLSAAGDTLAVRMQLNPASLANVDLLGRYDIVTYNGDAVAETFTLQNALINNLNVLDLFQSGGIQTLLFQTSSPYDRVDVVARSLVNVALTPPIRLYSVTRIGPGCPTITTPSPFENPVCVTDLIASSNADDVANLFDDNFDSYATLNSGSNALLGQLLGGQANQYTGFVELGFDAPIPANKTAYVRIDFDQTVLSKLLGGSLGSAVATLVDNLLLGNHFFTVEAKSGNTVVLQGGSNNNFGNNTNRIRIVQDKQGRFYIALTPSVAYDAIRITDHTNTAIPLTAQANSMHVYGACVDNPLTDCQPVFTTSYDVAGLNLTAAGLAGSGAGVDNADHAINDNTTDYSELSLGTLAVGQSVRQYFDFRKLALPSEVVNLRLQYGSGGLNVNLIGALEIIAYNGAVPVDTLNVQSQLINGLNVLGILNNATGGVVPYAPGVEYDRISIGLRAVASVGVLPELRIYAVEKDCTSPMFKVWKSYREVTSGLAVANVKGGEEIEYTLHIANTGGVDLTGYRLVDTIPGFTTYVAGSGGVLAADSVVFENLNIAVGDTLAQSFRVTVNTDLTGATEISNVAFIKASATQPGTGTVPPADAANPTAGPNENVPAGTPTVVPVLPVSTVTAWKGFAIAGGMSATSVSGGETVTYTVYIANTGNQDLTGVSIRDQIPQGTVSVPDNALTAVEFTGIDIPVGATVSRSFDVLVNENLTGITAINNVATVTAAGVPTETAPADPAAPASGPAAGSSPGDPTTIPVLLTDDVVAWKGYAIANGASASSVSGGEEVTYTIFIRNDANQDITGLSVRDALPAGTTFVSAANGGFPDAGTVRFAGINVAFGSTATVSFTVKVDSNLSNLNTISNVAFVQSDPADPSTDLGTVPPANPTDPAAGPDPSASPPSPTEIPVDDLYTIDLTLTGVSNGTNSGQAQENNQITYVVTVRNTGNKDLTNLVLTAGVPQSTTLTDDDDFTMGPDSLALTIPQLEVGETLSFTFVVTVDAGIDPSVVTAITNSASAINSEVGRTATSSLPTSCVTVEAADIAIGPLAPICIGEELTLTATLTGAAAAAPPTAIKWYGAFNTVSGAVSNFLGEGSSLTITPTQVGQLTYYAVIEDAGYCFNNPPAQIAATVNALPATPVINASAGTVCEGEALTLSASGGDSYRWTKDGLLLAETSGTLTIAAAALTDAGSYTVVAISAAGCESLASTSVQVLVNRRAVAADITLSGNGQVCQGASVELFASAAVGSPVFNWYDSETSTTPIFTGPTLRLVPTANTTYYVGVSGTNICENNPTDRAAISVTVNPSPVIVFDGPSSYSIEINETVPVPTFVQEPGVTYTWRDQSGAAFSGTAFGPFASPGTYVYTLIATGAGGCQTAATITIQVFNPGECPPVYERTYARNASQYSVSSLLGIALGTVTAPERAADQSLPTFSTLTEGANVLGLFGQTYQDIRWNNPIQAGTAVTVKLGKAFTTAQVLGGVRIQAFNTAGALVGVSQTIDMDVANLVAGLNIFDYSFVPTDQNGAPVAYSGIRVSLQAVASVGHSLQVYEAYHQAVGFADCDAQTDVLDVYSGIERPISGLGVLNGLVSVVDAANAVDGDVATSALLNNAVGVNAYSRLELLYATPALAGDTLTIRVAKPGTLLTANLLSSFTIQPYLGGTAVGAPVHNDNAVLNISVLGGGSAAEIKFVATAPYDRVKILYGGVASVVDQLSVNEVTRTIPRVVAGPNGDNIFEICPGGDISIPVPDNCTAYLIYDAPTGGSTVEIETLAAGTVTTVYVQTVRFGSCETGERTPIEIRVGALPPAPVVVNAVLCQTLAPATVAYNVTALPNHSLVYYASELGTAPLTDVPVANSSVAGTTIVYVSQLPNGTNGCEGPRIAVSITVTAVLPPALTELAQSFCAIDSATVADLNTAGATGTVVWYSSATGGTALAPSTLLASGDYYAAQLADSCESVGRTMVTVTVTSTPAPALTELSQVFCEIDSATVADLNTAGAAGAVVWYNAEAGGPALAPTAPLLGGSYYAAQVVDGCESAQRTLVTVTVTSTPAPALTELNQAFCEIDSATVADLNTAGAAGAVVWYNAATGGTAVAPTTLLFDGIYYAADVVGGCESIDRTAVTVRITRSEPPTIDNANPIFCASDNATLADIAVVGTGVSWYSSAAGGTALPAETMLQNGVTYYASQIVDGCESLSRLAVTPIVNDCAARLTITKLADDNSVRAGESTSFRLTITNTGPGAIAVGDVLTLAELPSAGLTITGYSITSGNASIVGAGNDANITATQVIPVGGTVTVAVTAIVAADAPATIRNGVKVWGPDNPPTEDPDDEDETPEIPVERESVLRITKVADQPRVQAGSSTSFTVTIINDGPAAIASGRTIALAELPSAGLTITGYAIGSGAATVVGNATGATVTTNAVIPLGGSIVVKVSAAVAADAPATIRNGVQVWGPDKPITEDPDDEDETPEIPVDRESRLQVEKIADEARVKAGEATSFTISITNTGPAVIAPGQTINLTERPGAGVSIQGYSVMGTNATIVGSQDRAALTTTAVIPVNGTIIVKIAALVDEDAPETITNGITVWGPDKPDTEDPDDEDDTDPIPVDHPLIMAVDDVAETKTGVAVDIAVLENDIVTKWEINPSTVEIVSFTPGSTVLLLPNGEVSYTSARDFIGQDNFSYRVKDVKGRWSNTANVRVSVVSNPLVIPNVITPNGDNLNDRLVILGVEAFDRISLTVINRWGNEVYQNDNYKGEWDGRGLNDGTYFVFVRAIKGGSSIDVKSTVLIKRN